VTIKQVPKTGNHNLSCMMFHICYTAQSRASHSCYTTQNRAFHNCHGAQSTPFDIVRMPTSGIYQSHSKYTRYLENYCE
jgi:hypothetical protein